MLSLYLTILIVFSQIKTKYTNILQVIFFILLATLVIAFSTTYLIIFYFWFESSLLPIFIIIMGWGYQPERILAGLYIFFYTLFASLPLLIIIIILNITTINSIIWRLNLVSMWSINKLPIYTIFMVLAFLVKFPIYYVHLWLPKAHVEAPVTGSIILAGVLLKLGGYGIVRVFLLNGEGNIIYVFRCVALMGGGLLGIICLVNSDIKVVIAYSSVVHMSLIILGILSLFSLGLEGRLMVIIAHGVCSSGMFYGANIIYERSHSRRYFLNSGGLSKSSDFSILWFLLIMANFGGPFTINLLGEIILIINVSIAKPLLLYSILLLSFFSARYRLILYSTTQQGQARSITQLIHNYDRREKIITISHIWPIFMLPLCKNFI